MGRSRMELYMEVFGLDGDLQDHLGSKLAKFRLVGTITCRIKARVTKLAIRSIMVGSQMGLYIYGEI